ncbi:MAG: hypothetical protein U5K43_14350 [Halofilum sp. (in: g-proteobacteria)]|nr:hypothetical protein [Halofilum sp. (in: g-proteobacteria)]
MLVLVAALLLTACGFQLRGSYRLPDDLFPLYIDAPGGSDVARELRDTLGRQDVALADDPEGAATILAIVDESAGRRIPVGGQARPRSRNTRSAKTVRWKLERRHGDGTDALVRERARGPPRLPVRP